MKVAIITDQHFGCRKNSKLFHDYFLKFYNNIFFPTLEKEGITTIIDMGDTFDSRKGIDFSALSWAKNNYYDRLKDMGCKVHTIVGNHTAYYKNTNQVNAVDLLLREYDNVKTYSETTEVKIDNLNVLFVPWINPENEKKSIGMINKSNAPVCMGHLDLNGFYATQGHVQEHGMDCGIFEKFKLTFSGHFHIRSTKGSIHYLGNPYEMFWNDSGDANRGFHIFDTDTLEFTPVNNPYRLFYKIFYDDIDYQLFDARPYENKIVKVIVRTKSDIQQFEKFIDKLYASGVNDLKIVENFNFNGWDDIDDEVESEDTMSILNRYIEEAEVNLDKSIIQKMMQEIYQEACEMI